MLNEKSPDKKRKKGSGTELKEMALQIKAHVLSCKIL